MRPAAVSGQFYPGERKELEKTIEELLSRTEPPKAEGEIFGLLLPHAGYIFSGAVAAYGFKSILGKNFDTVILIGDSHYERFDGISIWPKGSWETPLGEVPVQEQMAQGFLSCSKRIFQRDSAHLFEHSLEVQLPFLQKVLKNFKILPIIFGSEDEDWQELSEIILKNIKGRNVLIVASSDLSHYYPYQEARQRDKKTLEAIVNLKNQNLDVCGKDAIKTLMEITRKLGGRARLLNNANSGDAAGDKSRVVGYGAVAFYFPKDAQELLNIARTSVETFIRERKIPEFEVKSELLKEKRGVFVTLKKQGELRGCIGYIAADRPLFQIIPRMALAAAFEDPRFPPVTEQELSELEYEVSILTPLRKIDSLQEINVGVHGVQVIAGSNSGLFLPQVATENNWDLETFLKNLMLKAGLQPNHWKKRPVDFYIFEAEIIKD